MLITIDLDVHSLTQSEVVDAAQGLRH